MKTNMGDALKSIRKQVGLTQEKLGANIGRDKGGVCKIEKSGNRMTLRTVRKYLGGLGKTLSFEVEGDTVFMVIK